MITHKKLILFGTSRLHRPFAKRHQKELVINTHPNYDIVFPKIGYLHTGAEILQAIKFIQNTGVLQKDLRRYVFRIEPRTTTPLNEFDSELETCIRQNTTYNTSLSLNDVESLVIEISSLTVNRHIETGTILHTNPNIVRDIPYNQIYPDGYYKKFEPNLPVEKVDTGLTELRDQLHEIKSLNLFKNIFVLSHLRSANHPNALRDKIHRVVAGACSAAECTYIDTADILDEFGFSETAGIKDIHHLSHDGENALARRIFATLDSYS